MKKILFVPANDRFTWVCPAKPYYLSLMAGWVIFDAYQKYRLGWPRSGIFFENNNKCYFHDYLSEVRKNGLETISLRYQKNGRLKNIKKEYDKIGKVLSKRENEITPAYLKKIDLEQLILEYKDYLKLFKEFWVRAIFAELSGYGAEFYLKENLPLKLFKNRDEAINILIKSSDYSFFQKEQIEFLKILQTIKINQRKFKNYKIWLKYLIKHLDLKNKLDKHAGVYNWINNGYESNKPLPNSYFYLKAWEILNGKIKPRVLLNKMKSEFREGEIKRKKVLKIIPNNSSKIYFSKAGECVAWHDDKKGQQLKFQRALHYFLREFSARFKLDFDKLLNCLPNEFDKIIKTGKLPIKELKKRKRIFLFEANTKRIRIITGAEVVRVSKAYQKIEVNLMKQIKGLVVSGKGNITGKTRIIHNSKDLKKVKKNDILVAEMTSPEYIQALRLAKAVITDEGGLTCHAAIVSRELGIPCIVGTKIATKVFKTGDFIEVDAKLGIVKKIR